MLKISKLSGKAMNYFFDKISWEGYQLEGGITSFTPGSISYNPVTGLLSVSAPSCEIFGYLHQSGKTVTGKATINYDILMLI